MSRWRVENLEIGGSAVVLTRGGVAQTLQTAAGDWPALAAELALLLPAKARLAVRVADCWLRYWLLELPAGVAGLRDGELLLNARFEALYGQSPADWLIRADWQAGKPMLACALPRSLPQALAGFRITTLQPALVADWNRSRLPATGVWCAATGGVLTLLYWQEGVLRCVRQQRGGDAESLLALELTRLDADQPVARFWSGEAGPASWQRLELKP